MASVLLIDDDFDFRSMIAETLKSAGHEVIEASDGLEGLHRFAESPVDLVITDMVMPGADGVEVINALREINSVIKILAVTGGGVIEPGYYANIAGSLGADMTLQKPFSLQKLLDSVDDLVG